MTLKEYQKETLRTLPDLGSYQLNICHMIMGMGGEFNEIVDATDVINLREELQDVGWYLSNYCNLTGIDLNEHFEFMFGSYFEYFRSGESGQKHIIRLQSEISKLTDLEKKKTSI
jgi:NTP pyrophosphatase (non-canonical NTP hydrolase)